MSQASTLFILNSTGDMQLTWDHTDPAEIEKARAELQALKDAGYEFFLVDGTPADAIAAGAGTLNCRRANVADLLPAEPPIDEQAAPQEQAPARRGPGRTPTNEKTTAPPVTAVATRQMRGG